LTRRRSRTLSRSTPSSSLTLSNSLLKRKLRRKSLMMRKKSPLKVPRSKKSLMRMKRRMKRRRRPSRKLLSRTRNSTRPSLSGPATLRMSSPRNTLNSIRLSLTIGKTIWPSSTSPLKVNLNSVLSFTFPSVLLSICSKPRRRETTSSSTSVVSSSWMTVRI
jgi:hypothetical protein